MTQVNGQSQEHTCGKVSRGCVDHGGQWPLRTQLHPQKIPSSGGMQRKRATRPPWANKASWGPPPMGGGVGVRGGLRKRTHMGVFFPFKKTQEKNHQSERPTSSCFTHPASPKTLFLQFFIQPQ